MNRAEKLTKNQNLVLHCLRKTKKPESAYTLLDLLKKEGLNAPPQIYRALDKLIKVGLVHKIHSNNTFVSCNSEHHCSSSIFSVCNNCGTAAELEAENADVGLMEVVKRSGFHHEHHITEVFGLCADCFDQSVRKD